jgi:hypothetical protein
MELVRRIETFQDWTPIPDTRHKNTYYKIANKPKNKAILETGGSIWLSSFGGLSREEIKILKQT